MARKRGATGGGAGDVGFLRRLISQIGRRVREGLRPGRRPQCYQWTYRWEWLTQSGERVASGVHMTVTQSNTNYQGASASVRREIRPEREQSRPKLERSYGPVRLRLERVGEVLPVPGPC